MNIKSIQVYTIMREVRIASKPREVVGRASIPLVPCFDHEQQALDWWERHSDKVTESNSGATYSLIHRVITDGVVRKV